MKLVIQVPCHNEEETLGATLAALPREMPGFDSVEWLVVDDGSTDRTVDVARAHGVDHLVRIFPKAGLATAFKRGIAAGLAAGADVIVNTDGDNQYCAEDIVKLTEPILAGRAGFVIGERPILQMRRFSFVKKRLQVAGSRVVGLAAGVRVADATSGFRAMSRKTAEGLRIFSHYTFTAETLIQAGRNGMGVEFVPVRVNDVMRPSRLIPNLPSYVFKQAVTIVKAYWVYR